MDRNLYNACLHSLDQVRHLETRAEHGTYKLSPDEEYQAILKHQRQSRLARILQVRSQEMLLGAKSAREFRQRRKKDNQKLLQVLKDAWQEEQAKRKAALKVDYLNSCKGIGRSHDAAQLVAQNSGAIAERKAKEAEVNELCGNLRFQRAMQKENARKQEVFQEKALAKDRRKVLSEAAKIERRRARIHACHARSDARDEGDVVTEEEVPEKYLKIECNRNDIRPSTLQSRLPGAPSDYKDTYFHARFSVLNDRDNVNQGIVDADHSDKEAEVDAWEAAQAQMKNVEKEKERKAELEELWKRRKAERGQAAAARLQKIAVLEKALAVELEEEQERKHQLQILEDLTKAVRTPEYKRDTWRHQQPTLVRANKELDGYSEAKTEKVLAKTPEVQDSSCATGSKVSPSTPKQVLHQGTEGVAVIVQSSLPVIADERSAHDLSSEWKVEGETVDKTHEVVGFEDAETKVMEAAATKEERSAVVEPNVYPTECKDPGLSMAELLRRLRDKDGDSLGPPGSAKLASCTPRSHSAVRGPKATKHAKLSSKISSLPHVSRKSGVRKGNKSPQKYEGERAPRSHEDQEAAAYIKEFKARSTVAEKDQARPSVNSVGEFGVERAVFAVVANAAESCTTESRKKSPRKETSNWLSNILENFPWWKCDSSIKEFSCPGVRLTYERMDSFRKSDKHTDCLYGLENVGRVNTPRMKHKEESSQDVAGARKNIPFRLETLGSLNTLRDTDWYCEEQPGWSEARTKVVFTKEELEALKLELYGTLTGETITSHQKKVILGKEMAKQGPRDEPKPQGLKPLLFPPQLKEQIQKTRSIDEESDQQSRSQTREERLEHPRSPTPKPDKTKSVTTQKIKVSKEDETFQDKEERPVACPLRKCISVQDSRSDEWDGPPHRLANKGEHNHGKKPSTKDCATQYDFSEFVCVPKQEQGFSKESVKKGAGEVQVSLEAPGVSRLQDEAYHNPCQGSGNKVQTPVGTSEHQREACASSELNLSTKKGKASDELGSARQVAEELIQAWRAGQIGGDIHATFRRAKQVSRKRRVTTGEDVQQQVSTSYPETTQKLGQLREKIYRPEQNSATKLRKWDVLTPPHSGEAQGKRVSGNGSASRSQDIIKHTATLRKVLSPPKASNQQCKEECSRVSGNRFSEEAMDREVEDIVPEARSLDFILGSLSAQVRELDERLQNVTACSIGTTDVSLLGNPGEREENKAISGVRDPATSIITAYRVSQVPGRTWSHLQCSTGEDSETGKTPIIFPERERINKAKNTKAAPVNPLKGPLIGLKTGCNLPSSQKQQDKSKGLNSTETRLGGSIQSSIPQVQSPVSSSGICLEDMAELMQEMNGSPACQEMRAQLLQDSFLENLPRRRVSGSVSIEQEDSELRCAGEHYRNFDASPVTKSQTRQEEGDRASNFIPRKFADVCSRKCEPAVLDGLETLDTAKQISDGITFSSVHAVTRSASQQPEGIPRSSLDLEDAMRLDGNDEYLLLSSSVDFSPWSTANLPDIFTTITDVGKGLNYIFPLGPVRVSKDGSAKPEHCHLKESSKYLLKNHEFKRKCRAFGRKRLGQGKGKLKKNVRKPFNPLALPSKRVLSSRSSTRSVRATPQPGGSKFSRRDVKLTNDSRLKSKLTGRSLPEHFQKSIAGDEVQEWLHRDATSCLLVTPDQLQGGRSVVKYRQSAGTKKSEGLVMAAESLSRQQGRTSPPLVMTTPEVVGRQLLDRKCLIERDLEARRRPSSAVNSMTASHCFPLLTSEDIKLQLHSLSIMDPAPWLDGARNRDGLSTKQNNTKQKRHLPEDGETYPSRKMTYRRERLFSPSKFHEDDM